MPDKPDPFRLWLLRLVSASDVPTFDPGARVEAGEQLLLSLGSPGCPGDGVGDELGGWLTPVCESCDICDHCRLFVWGSSSRCFFFFLVVDVPER